MSGLQEGVILASHLLVTGATGFIGRHLVIALANSGKYKVSATVRADVSDLPESVSIVKLQLGSAFDELSLDGVDTVIHLAALAHEPSRNKKLDEYRLINVLAAAHLARRAGAAGVKRFIFLSSIGVNGSSSISPFTANDVPSPEDHYSVSKYEAELELRSIASAANMELVVIRPPLVYGPNAPGNFSKLVAAIQRGFLLPFGGIHNKRTLVSVYNLVDFISVCIEHPLAANETFVIGDAEDISTCELLAKIGRFSGRPARLVFIPVSLLYAVATAIGKRRVAQKICGDLQVDTSKARDLLGWKPPLSLDDGLRRCFIK
ncbi:NAD-dependent epimerase/dehydratase family protein [Phytopseudomonas daroniae]|uniref:NAD-dependent epimerase/dehydratase family protein n=1 Tax=Phytopseudomonas daroniae TaxID=2487519 RepID=UPI0010384DCB|nr:NAD-dependent epimerase/dehydratase family protein [Pseudomonas daroniae]TBU74531.1 hypothetical protein DNK10_14135 [Pseudomonas daroniae]